METTKEQPVKKNERLKKTIRNGTLAALGVAAFSYFVAGPRLSEDDSVKMKECAYALPESAVKRANFEKPEECNGYDFGKYNIPSREQFLAQEGDTPEGISRAWVFALSAALGVASGVGYMVIESRAPKQGYYY